jgi:hypothetical protein
MTRLRNALWFAFVCSIVGGALGSYLSSFNMHDVDRVAFWWRPVVAMQGVKVGGVSGEHILVNISGRKLRGEECVYKGIQAFGDRVVGEPIDLYIARQDMPEAGVTKPKGSYSIGVWKVWPVLGVDVVRVYVMHDCGTGRLWATKIAEVKA